jgi:hypothetical protein
MASDDTDFHLFVSYTRTPDAALAQEVERFLESFHTVQPPGGSEPLPPLRICVDGSDFSMPPVAEREGRTREILDVVYAHLARARELLVLCSSGAAGSEWVDDEIRWFIVHQGAGRIRIAFTEGAAPQKEPARYFPPAVLEHGLLKGLAYDLRGYDPRRAKGWQQVADFSREMVRLAADLHGRSAGDLYPTWLEAELERARRQSTTMASNARFETFAGDPARAVLAAYQAHQLYPSEAGEAGLRDAYRVAVMHHHNRRQIAQITGSGPSYLAGRWKQGDVFTKTSPDGRFRLLVTERGPDGPNPPGEVFLLNNETLRAVQLLPPEPPGARVEEVTFDRATERILVTRYFNLCVYGTDGGLLGQYTFSRHTKSPVHLLDGLFHDRWILGAETKGGVWLVDPAAGNEATITVHPEFYRDATVATDMSPDRRRMTLVYESGKADLLELDADGRPRLSPLAEGGTLYAGFPTARNDHVVLTGRDGKLRILEIDGDEVREFLHTEAFGSDVDWVSWDAEANRFALVGGDRSIHIADAETGLRIATLNYAEAIDWADTIALPVPRTFVDPGAAWEPGEGVPFPNDELAVSAFERTGDQDWIVTEEWPNEHWPTRRVHLLANCRAHFLAEGYGPIHDYGDLLMLDSHQVFVRVSKYLRPFPQEVGYPECVLGASDALWIGTRGGAFRKQGDRFERMTPPSINVEGLVEIDGAIWMRGRTGAYAFTDGRLLRLTDPFLLVASIQRAGGKVWILGKTEGSSGGPAWRVDGWLASAVPSRDAQVRQIFETPDAVWLTDRTLLHRVRGDAVDSVDTGLEVSALQRVGRSIWCTTKRPGFLGGVGPLLRVDGDTLEVQVLDLVAPILISAGGAVFVTHVVRPEWKLFDTPVGGRAVARLDEREAKPIELGDADAQHIVEHRGAVWVLTSGGAFTLDRDRVERVAVPALSYTGLAWSHGSTWLFATTAAVRLRGRRMTVFETEQAVRDVLRVRGDAWILTSNEVTGPGPAYRVRGSRTIGHAPGGAGMASVADYDDATWLLTRRDGRAGPMVRVGG